MKSLVIKGRKIVLPDFYPDATKGVIRACSSEDVTAAGINGLIVNTYHLLTQPGPSVLSSYEGIKNYMNWPGTIISDSGGWQMFSLIHRDKGMGSISKDGVTFFKTDKSGKHKYKITPEKCIQVQFAINSDIMICLDYFTDPKGTQAEKELSIKLTVDWAQRCKDEFEKLCSQKKLTEANRPLLFCVLQGGRDPKLIEECAKGLEDMGFDGWGLGGWLFDTEMNLDIEIVNLYSSFMPKDKPKYALGIGNPQAVVDCVKAGFDIFDCVLPTRDGRHKRLYVFTKDPTTINFEEDKNWYGYVNIQREKHVRDFTAISPFCDCFTCKNYTKAYLRHLFEIEDTLAYRLATIHNLRMYTMLMEKLRLE